MVEGLDGSGKSTQIELLLEHIRDMGVPCQYLHFPRTDTSLYGELIARYLRGELGPVESVHPYLVALIFAGDRFEARDSIRGWLSAGQVVVTDRYVVSNIAFQCAKLKGGKERAALKDWILKLEYGHHEIPRPDLSIFLDVPFGFTREKLTAAREGNDRNYLNGRLDIHEQDLDLQRRVRQVYLEVVEEDPRVSIVDCSDGKGNMLGPDEIFQRVRNLIYTS